ncbi:MAG: cation-translocating P-type ATPase, partial [Chloroflexi bacterium]|nr:cation-translocating P-type ATPase [Chloroflexota bacterium]
MTIPDLAAPETSEVTFPVTGMTCASCVRRVEKALGRVDGVRDATVNLATEKAHVVYDPQIASAAGMRAAVEKAGYGVRELDPSRSSVAPTRPAFGVGVTDQAVAAAPQPSAASESTTPDVDPVELERQRELDDLRRKWVVSLTVGVVMMALTYAPTSVPMDVLAPVMLIAATIVQFWAGRPIYQAAWTAARHGGTDMNTLVAVGTSVAYAYSAFVTLWPRVAMQLGFPGDLYFETGVIVIALILLGRWLEARAKRQTGAAIQALMGLQVRTARVVRDGLERDLPIEAVQVGDLVRVRPGEKVPVDGLVEDGRSAVDESHDLRKRRVGADAGGSEDKAAGGVERGANHHVARTLVNRQAFTG